MLYYITLLPCYSIWPFFSLMSCSSKRCRTMCSRTVTSCGVPNMIIY